MRNKFILLGLLIMAMAAPACRKCCYPGPDYYLATRNDMKEWSVSAPTATLKQDTLIMTAHGGDETLALKIKFTGLGKYKLTGNQVRFFANTWGDILIADYYVDAGAESILNITNYDSATTFVAGDFTLKLTKTPSFTGTYNAYPQKLNFPYGGFVMQVVK